MADKIRLLIVDDVLEVRIAVRRAIRGQRDIEVVGESTNGEEAVRAYELLMPNVVSMDINMPIMDGITATAAIRSRHPDARIFILSVQTDVKYLKAAMMAGAFDYLTLPPTDDELISVIRSGAYSSGRWYDVFISHATEDKDFARPLANALAAKGLSVWYDEFELRIGDSLRQKIDFGLARSRFGVVILSHAFFAKNWTRYELNSLVTREIAEGQMILPVWHRITKSEIMAQSPALADKVARNTSDFTIEEIADEIASVIGNFESMRLLK